jgi:hypothetical protein
MMRLQISTEVDSRPPFDGERYWRWTVYREGPDEGSRRIFATGWTRTKADALRLARIVRREIKAGP